MNKDFVRHFLTGFFSIFKISKTKIRKKAETNLLEYFIKIEKDINSTFQEIKKNMKDRKSFFANNNRLNKGYSKVSNNNPRETDNSFYRKKFEHVMPPIDLMEEYENLHPGTLEKLMLMAEKEQTHRHQMDIKSIEVYESITKKGRISAVIFMIMVCITTLVLALLGHFMIASIFTVSVLLMIGTVFFLSSAKFTRQKDYNKR